MSDLVNLNFHFDKQLPKCDYEFGWGNDHGSKYRLRDHVLGRQDIILFSGAPNLNCGVVSTLYLNTSHVYMESR
jgi:hypothetical protein